MVGKDERMCLRSTMGDPGFLFRGSKVSEKEPSLVLRLHLHLKVTLKFHRVQSYSQVICSSLALGPEVARASHLGMVFDSWAVCCLENSL